MRVVWVTHNGEVASRASREDRDWIVITASITTTGLRGIIKRSELMVMS